MAHPLKDLAKRLLYYGGYYGLRSRLARLGGKHILILMYHDIVSSRKVDRQHAYIRRKLRESEFAAHLRVLSQGYRVLSVAHAIREMRDRGDLTDDTVAITFDDGYESVYNIAYPLLKKYNLPATVFPITDWIDGKLSMWAETVGNVIEQCDLKSLDTRGLCDLMGFEPQALQLPSNNDRDIKRGLIREISDHLMRLPDDMRQDMLKKIQARLAPVNGNSILDARSLTWEQIIEMSSGGIEIGAHTCSHANLSHLDPDAIRDEISGAKRELENRLGEGVNGFAYPYGYDFPGYRYITPILKQAGFSYACTSCSGNNRRDSDHYMLLRDTLPATKSTPLLKRAICLNLIGKNRYVFEDDPKTSN